MSGFSVCKPPIYNKIQTNGAIPTHIFSNGLRWGRVFFFGIHGCYTEREREREHCFYFNLIWKYITKNKIQKKSVSYYNPSTWWWYHSYKSYLWRKIVFVTMCRVNILLLFFSFNFLYKIANMRILFRMGHSVGFGWILTILFIIVWRWFITIYEYSPN